MLLVKALHTRCRPDASPKVGDSSCWFVFSFVEENRGNCKLYHVENYLFYFCHILEQNSQYIKDASPLTFQ